MTKFDLSIIVLLSILTVPRLSFGNSNCSRNLKISSESNYLLPDKIYQDTLGGYLARSRMESKITNSNEGIDAIDFRVVGRSRLDSDIIVLNASIVRKSDSSNENEVLRASAVTGRFLVTHEKSEPIGSLLTLDLRTLEVIDQILINKDTDQVAASLTENKLITGLRVFRDSEAAQNNPEYHTGDRAGGGSLVTAGFMFLLNPAIGVLYATNVACNSSRYDTQTSSTPQTETIARIGTTREGLFTICNGEI